MSKLLDVNKCFFWTEDADLIFTKKMNAILITHDKRVLKANSHCINRPTIVHHFSDKYRFNMFNRRKRELTDADSGNILI